MLNILVVFGTRPEAIKLAPVIKELNKYPNRFKTTVCVTGQHAHMVDPILKLLDIRAHYDLKIMRANQNLQYITTQVLNGVESILNRQPIDWVLVQGDTTSAFAASLAAYYKKVKIGHIEAGLRTWDKDNPYPEEFNRKAIDAMSDLHFAHSNTAKMNLLKEGIKADRIEVTGNTVIDALLASSKIKYTFKDELAQLSNERRKMILVTAHRRENWGQPFHDICQAIKELSIKYKDEAVFIYPVHLNPNVKETAYDLLGKLSNVILTKPLEYLPLIHVLKRSYLVLTDSGGLQEEAPSFGKPVLVLRKLTERPEGVKAGCVKVIGTETKAIVKAVQTLISDPSSYKKMSKARNPYGNGTASRKIVARLAKKQ